MREKGLVKSPKIVKFKLLYQPNKLSSQIQITSPLPSIWYGIPMSPDMAKIFMGDCKEALVLFFVPFALNMWFIAHKFCNVCLFSRKFGMKLCILVADIEDFTNYPRLQIIHVLLNFLKNYSKSHSTH